MSLSKLTLTIDPAVIMRAKNYAKQHNMSLSKLVERYFEGLARETENQPLDAPITQSLAGIVKLSTTQTDKELLQEALIQKYL